MSDTPRAASERRTGRGCLIALAALVGLYVVFQAVRIGQIETNRATWIAHRPDRYQMSINAVSITPWPGPSPITVERGRVTLGDGRACEGCPALPDVLFDHAEQCVAWFPMAACSVTFDPVYGFPVRFQQQVFIPMSDAGELVEVRDFKPLP